MTAFPSKSIHRALAGALALMWTTPGIAASCMVIAQGVSFGSYDPFSSSDLDGVGNVRLDCDVAVNATISLSPGAGTYSSRLMTNGPSNLGYNLFTTSQRVAVWGDGSGSSDSVSANVQTGDFPIYGTIAARQNVTTGVYQDTVIITVTY